MNSLPEAFAEVGVTLPLLIAGWASVGLILIGLALVVLGAVRDWEGTFFTGGVFIACGACGALVWAIMLMPYDGKFHHYYEVSGTVTDVSNVLSEANGDLTRQPVVTLDTVERPLVIDDPRAVSLLNRDVILRCSVEWNYQAADSYSCRIVDFGGAA